MTKENTVLPVSHAVGVNGASAMDAPTTGNAILLLTCPDQKGVVAKLSQFVYERGGNIVHADQHSDPEAGLFLTRIEWELEGFDLKPDEIAPALKRIADTLGADWTVRFSAATPRIAL